MQFAKLILPGIMALLLAIGCSQGPQKPTAKQDAGQRWDNARAGIFFSLANDQFLGGNLNDARKSVNNAARLAPANIKVALLSARIHIEQGSLELAEADLERARSIEMHNGEVDYLKGIIYQRWQKPEVALDCYTKACQKNPQELAYLLAQAEMLVAMEQSPKALALLREKLNSFQNSPAIRDEIGQLLAAEGRYQEAAPMLQQASVLAPDEQPIREHYALALFYNKQHREALQVLQRLMKDDKYKSRADLHTAVGECQLALNEPRDARDSFEVASQLSPGGAGVWLNIAKAALQLDDLKRAEISLKKAMTLSEGRDSADANLMMGYLRLQQSKLDEALAHFRKASALDPQDPVSLCMSGFVLEKLGRSNEAIRHYSQALKIKPNDELATTLLAKVQVQE